MERKDFKGVYGEHNWIVRWLVFNSFIRYVWVEAVLIFSWNFFSDEFTKSDLAAATIFAIMISFFAEIFIRDALATRIMFKQAEIDELKSQIEYLKRQSGQ